VRRAATALCLTAGLSVVGLADEAHVLLPSELARAVSPGNQSGLIVGLERRVDSQLATVSLQLRALGAPARYPIPEPESCGDPEALSIATPLPVPGEIGDAVRRTTGSLAVVEHVVRWVSRAIALDEGDIGPQDAASVLRRGHGRCSGRANLSVGLLRSVGVPARVVHGVLLAESGPRWHRWGEAWLGDVGWVPFDPGSSVGVVSVRHLPLTAPISGTLSGVKLESLNGSGFLTLPVRGGLRVLPTEGVTLRCRGELEEAIVVAALHAPDGSRWARMGSGEVSFPGLLPGWYRLSWIGSAGILGSAMLRLGNVREVSVSVAERGGA